VVLHLDRVAARGYPREEVPMLAHGGKLGVVLDAAQHVRYTGGVHKIAPYGPGSGVFQHRRGHLFIRHAYYTILYCFRLPIVVIFCEESSAKYRAWRSMWSGLRN
jgi:hypothetical protein